ncbi:two-component system sensor histidine kinase YesM [Lachnotalea glycerini]|uniref:Two-component system sensor histidine kinase YesM n=1 Tax=Lachnotalea glycerini TaxID=1763509 RepID=A0A318EYV2_9FIRM|nr:sensor histidine kinase [Lachnotalea glycerini]PXV93334.1 two-component system sensor histidine kinase YesM [Lachnotalea glycerini]
MNKWIDNLISAYKKLSMQKKMIYAFSIPVIIICMLINLVSYHVISQNYKNQLRYLVDQSCEQAKAFILNYVENMYYTSVMISDNSKVENILASSEFSKDKDLAEQYREFWNLKDAFQNIGVSNPTFRIGMYIPDYLIYSNNNDYFYPSSSLQSREDYEEMMQVISNGKMYFALIDESEPSNPSRHKSYLSLFKRMEVTDNQQEKRSYICKVEVLVSEFEKILKNANNTKNGLIYLLDEDKEILVSSDDSTIKNMYDKGCLPKSKLTSWSQWNVDDSNYYVLWQSIEESNWQIVSLIPVDQFQQQSNFIWFMILTIVIVISIAVIIISILLSRYYVGRLSKLNQKMKTLEKGKLNADIYTQYEQSGDEIDEIFINFNYMTDKLRSLMLEHYKLGKSVMSAELKALQAQINPHFLYNTLDLINWSAMDYGAQEIVDIAHNLGQFYRLSLNHGKNAILIDEELKHVEAYVNIENVHFDGAIKLMIDVPNEIRSYACLNIILQPFVENSIIHGIAEHSEIKECNIKISAELEDEDIMIHIADDAKGMDESQVSQLLNNSSSDANNGYGVKNINFRIKLCYGDKYGITYDSIPKNGTIVHIRIPIMAYNELEDNLK